MSDDLRTRIANALWDFACPEALKRDNPEPGKAFLQMADAVVRELPQPIKPTPPELEDLTSIPDLKHDWGREWDADVHQGRICTKCEELSDCELCNPEWDSTYDCLVIQANNRNYRAMRLYAKAIERWEAQMDYWRELTSG